MKVYVYRNRDDDRRGPADLHFCKACGGWYGVPHTGSHCRDRRDSGILGRGSCACRFCTEATGRRVPGRYGFFTEARKWQP